MPLKLLKLRKVAAEIQEANAAVAEAAFVAYIPTSTDDIVLFFATAGVGSVLKGTFKFVRAMTRGADKAADVAQAGSRGARGAVPATAETATATETAAASAAGGGVPNIKTPYGPAVQSPSGAAIAARAQVTEGATLYRVGTSGKSQTTGAQFWALEHPSSPGFAARYGIPAENVANANFIQTATVKSGTDFVTRVAPAVGANPGGGIEVVVGEGGLFLDGFSHFGF